jgi:hypothetical protein
MQCLETIRKREEREYLDMEDNSHVSQPQIRLSMKNRPPEVRDNGQDNQ